MKLIESLKEMQAQAESVVNEAGSVIHHAEELQQALHAIEFICTKLTKIISAPEREVEVFTVTNPPLGYNNRLDEMYGVKYLPSSLKKGYVDYFYLEEARFRADSTSMKDHFGVADYTINEKERTITLKYHGGTRLGKRMIEYYKEKE